MRISYWSSDVCSSDLREKEASGIPLGATALESTIAMIGGLFAAWLFLPFQPTYVFPLAAIAVGTHYAVFKTVYGDALFWVLGGLITATGKIGRASCRERVCQYV